MKDYKYHYAMTGKLYLSRKGKEQVVRTAGCGRFVYNRLVAAHSETYRLKKAVSALPWLQDRIDFLRSSVSTISAIKNAAPFLYEVDDCALQNAKRHYAAAWKNHAAGRGGIPTFHRKSESCQYQTNPHYPAGVTSFMETTGFRFVDRAHIILPKIGKVRVKFSPDIIRRIFERDSETRVGTVTVRRDACGEFFISVLFGSDTPFVEQMEPTGKRCAFDMNIDNFLTMDDGTVIDNPRHLLHAAEKLAKEQRILSRRMERAKAEGRSLSSSSNYQKQRVRVARVHRQIFRQRHELQNIVSKDIIKNHDAVFAEDLKAKNLMQNHCLARAIADVSWRSFLILMGQKAAMYGRTFLTVDPKYTTQTCSSCGHVMSGNEKLDLSDRQWECPACGASHLRDHNAAKNILAAGLLQLSP